MRLNPHGWNSVPEGLLAFDESFANPYGGIWGQSLTCSWVLENAGNDDAPRQPEAAGHGSKKQQEPEEANPQDFKGALIGIK